MTLVATKNKNRLFPNLMEDFFNDNFFKSAFSNGFTDESLVPNANIIENGKDYQIELAAPGLDKKDFKVEVENGVLTVSAEKEEEKLEEKENYRRREFSYNSFSRSFALPDNLLSEKIEAKYDNGILRLVLPKKEISPAKPVKQIKVN